MQKQAPNVGRILTMVLFALSCFGLLLFLWLSFGGPIPLKPQGYRFTVAFPEATTLGLEADVRIAGVNVGKVRQKELDPAGNRTLVTIELENKYAPVKEDARGILRQKTLLGETYVELTPGSPSADEVPEGGRLRNGRVVDSVQLDEIFEAFDPVTRQAFRGWQQSLSQSVEGRGMDLNDAFGNLPTFAAGGADLLEVLDTQSQAVSRLLSNTGVVFAALTRREDQLANLITNSEATFAATASQRESLAQSIQIFPTFLDESRLTLRRLQRFSVDTRPLIRDLRPVARDLRPTLRSVRLLAPDLKAFFGDLGPLITAARRGLPALRAVLRETRPTLASLGPFLQELNPILEWLEQNQREVSQFISNGIMAITDETESLDPLGRGHYLAQIGPIGAESIGVYRDRLPTNRGNAYVGPAQLDSKVKNIKSIIPSFDCNNAGGDQDPDTTLPTTAPGCLTQTPPDFQGQRTKYPQVRPNDYSKR